MTTLFLAANDAGVESVGFRTFYFFATALAAGILMTLPLVPIANLGRKFFILMSLISVVFYSLAVAAGDVGFNYCFAASTGLVIVYNVFLPPKGNLISTAILSMALLTGIGGLVVDSIQYPHSLPLVTETAWPIVLISFLSSALLLGDAVAAMILGHWYLVARGLSFDVLRRLTLLLIGAVAARIVAIAVAAYFQTDLWEELWYRSGGASGFLTSYGIFVGLRLLFGIVLPLVLSIMVWRCVRIRSNQSATGILYVLVAFVLMGEIVAKHLLISSRLLM
jgi:hypothetical protein